MPIDAFADVVGTGGITEAELDAAFADRIQGALPNPNTRPADSLLIAVEYGVLTLYRNVQQASWTALSASPASAPPITVTPIPAGNAAVTVTHSVTGRAVRHVVRFVGTASVPGSEVDIDIRHDVAGTASMTFETAPTAGQYELVTTGSPS